MVNEYQTSDAESESSGGGIEITDIYFILFRRKWLVIAGAILGILAAAGLWKLRQPMYQSEAKLLVKYVVETPAVVVPGTALKFLLTIPAARSMSFVSAPSGRILPGPTVWTT